MNNANVHYCPKDYLVLLEKLCEVSENFFEKHKIECENDRLNVSDYANQAKDDLWRFRVLVNHHYQNQKIISICEKAFTYIDYMRESIYYLKSEILEKHDYFDVAAISESLSMIDSTLLYLHDYYLTISGCNDTINSSSIFSILRLENEEQEIALLGEKATLKAFNEKLGYHKNKKEDEKHEH